MCTRIRAEGAAGYYRVPSVIRSRIRAAGVAGGQPATRDPFAFKCRLIEECAPPRRVRNKSFAVRTSVVSAFSVCRGFYSRNFNRAVR